MTAIKASYWKIRLACGLWLSRYGDRLGIESLTYNRVIFEYFNHYASLAAPGFVEVIVNVFPHVKRVVDVGCGTGHFVHAFREAGVSAEGFEYSRRAREVAMTELGVDVAPLDLRDATELTVMPADLAMSVEVAEHVPADLGDRLVKLLTRSAPLVFFTAATPGQGGTGHINEQPASYWIERFAHLGYRYQEEVTTTVRALLRDTVVGSPWIARNAMIFAAQRGTPASNR